jgi:tyrosinase
MAARIRRSVYALSATGPELTWYARAVEALSQLPRSQRGSWGYIAACHGLDDTLGTAPGAAALWRQCQHQTWFFLSWHRAYITGFEAIIAAKIGQLGGPANWALPYWNYSQAATSTLNPRRLPPAFRNQFNADGSKNWLWMPRNQPAPPNTVLTMSQGNVNTNIAMNQTVFSNAVTGQFTSFGGDRTGFSHSGNRSGALESVPHNVIHTNIGGAMRDPDTAALDPIFWLHHCNIDRLWEEWRKKLGAAAADPTQTQWLNGVTFDILTEKAANFKFKSAAALNSTTLLHGFRYDSVAPVVAGGTTIAMKTAKKAAVKTSIVAPGDAADEGMAEMVAANVDVLTLGAGRTSTSVQMAPNRRSLQAMARSPARETAARFILVVEGVTAKGPARDYRVFVDMPDDDKMPMQVGTLASFGVAQASRVESPHGGNGLTQSFDITDVFIELGLGRDAIHAVRVTFEPVRQGEMEAVPDDFPYKDMLSKAHSDLEVATVRIYAE